MVHVPSVLLRAGKMPAPQSQGVMAGALPGQQVKVRPDLRAVMRVVLVDAEEHHGDFAADVEGVVPAFFFPTLNRECLYGRHRLAMDLLEPLEFICE